MKIDYSRNELLTDFGKETLKDRYLLPGEDFQDRFAVVAKTYSDDADHAQRLYDYISLNWFMPATPILSNGGTDRGLPISCFLLEVDDSLHGIISTWHESAWLAARGGGIGVNWSNVRSIGEKVGVVGKTSGVIPFQKVQDSMTLGISQGCVDGITEILTEKGWVPFSELSEKHGKVCQVKDDLTMEFVKVNEYHKYKHDGILEHYTSYDDTVDHLVTENHRMVIERLIKTDKVRKFSGVLDEVLSKDLKMHRDNRFYTTGSSVNYTSKQLSWLERFLIAYQADGSTEPAGCSNGVLNGCLAYNFRFTRKRKINRFREILSNLDFYYSENIHSDGTTNFYVLVPMEIICCKIFSWVNLTEIDSVWAREFCEELSKWDGSNNNINSIKYSNTLKQACDKVSAIACIAGYKNIQNENIREKPSKRLYEVHICKNRNTVGGEAVIKKQVKFNDYVYCVSVPSGRFIARRNGRTLVTGNSLRRGSSAVYMHISHPEVEEFLEIRRPTGGDIERKSLNVHNALVIDDKFMEAVRDNTTYDLVDPHSKTVKKTISARNLWHKILTTRVETGEPYLLFIDNVNRARPDAMKKLGLEVKTSNLCVAPETLLLTDEGYKEIRSLENKEVNIWNGEQWSKTTVLKTAENVELIRVGLSDGSFIDCTPEHVFYTQDSYEKNPIKTKAVELNVGMKLEKWNLPDNNQCFKSFYNVDAYTQGFYSGDGNAGLEHSWIYEPKYVCLSRLVGEVSEEHKTVKRKTLQHGPLLSKFFVPIGYKTTDKLNWLAGLLDADGCVITSDNCNNIQLCSVDREFLLRTKLMLQELGVSSSVGLRRESGDYLLPSNDENGNNKLFTCNAVYLLNIDGVGTKKLIELGLKTERLVFLEKQEPQIDTSEFIKVVSIEKTGRISDTYCLTEPLRNRMMVNGIVTGNCNEIVLPTGRDHLNNWRTAVCCLSSVNLELFDTWKDNSYFIKDVLRFLDNVLQEFIDKTEVKEDMPEAKKDELRGFSRARYSAIRERSVGLGVMGLQSYFQLKNVAFESVMAKVINKKIFEHLKEEVDRANLELGEEKGHCPDNIEAKCKGRFLHATAIAPTASISVICGTTSPGIEPYNANAYTQKTLSGSFTVTNKHLKKLLASYDKDNDKVWKSIRLSEGSVQHLDFLSEHEKLVFKTAQEINNQWIVELACDRAPYIDQGQSVNIFIANNCDKNFLSRIHFDGWKNGLKGFYYCRSISEARAETDSLVPNKVLGEPIKYQDCLSCQ